MNQLTVRGFGDELERRIRRLAERENISLNKAALRLLERGAGLEPMPERKVIGDALDDFIGDWSDEEAAAFRESQKPFEQIDEEFWK
jgi:hypothetical protein